jgi:hypothetical protein
VLRLWSRRLLEDSADTDSRVDVQCDQDNEKEQDPYAHYAPSKEVSKRDG